MMATISKCAEVQLSNTSMCIKFFGKIIIIMLGSLCSQAGYAQFVPYSQYYNAPLLTNPSQAGVSDYTQFTLHYRRSRISNYEIPSLSFVRPFYRSSGLRSGAMGVNVISQKAGPGGAYKVMGATATFVYNVYLSKTQYISAGLQGGILSKKLDPSGLTTDSQYNLGVFDPSLSNGENIPFASEVRPVINSGFSWTMEDNEGEQRATLGVAFSNMNQPSFDILSGDAEKLGYTVTGEMRVYQRGSVSIHATFRYIKAISSMANIGTQLRIELPASNSNIALGGWYKTTKAMTAALQYTSERYVLAASADLSLGTDNQVNIQNAIELSWGWRLKRKTRTKPSPSSTESTPEISRPQPVTELLHEVEKAEPEKEMPQQTEIQQEVTVEDNTVTVPVEEVITQEEHEILQTNIAFALGSSDLAPASVVFIETRLVPLLKNHPGFTLHITGHSCTTGDKAINERISLARAQAIREILIGYGVPENQIVATGMDFQKPIASNDTEEGRQKNRRVEFELVR